MATNSIFNNIKVTDKHFCRTLVRETIKKVFSKT